jgi:hypothetical protein
MMLRYKRKGKDSLQRCANWAVPTDLAGVQVRLQTHLG